MTPQPDLTIAVLLTLLMGAYQRINELEAAEPPRISAGYIAKEHLLPLVDAAAERAGVTRAEILSPSRLKPVTHARGDVMQALYGEGYSTAVIGRALNRDHTTVLHWIRKGQG